MGFIANLQAREAQRVAAEEQAQYDLGQQRTRALLGEQKAQAREDFMPLLRQLPTTAAAALGPLLTSNDPTIQAQGMQQLQEYQGRNTPGYRQGLAANEQSMANAKAAEGRAAGLYPGQLTSQRLGIQGQQQSLAAGQMAMTAAEQALLKPPDAATAFKAETGLDLPKDFMVVRNPYTKTNQAVPMPNTTLYNQGADEMAKQEGAVRSLNQFLASVDQAGASGTEYIGPLAKEIKKRRYDAMAALRAAGNLGTPTGGEQAMVDELLPDPTGLWRNMYGAETNLLTGGMGSDLFKQNIISPYVAMRDDAQRKLEDLRKRYHYIPATPGLIPGQ